MIEQIDKKTINSCKERSPWTLGNEILYKMCADNFKHDSDEKIVAKVWLIGRSYAAAIERRKNKNPNDDRDTFYTETVVKTFMSSDLDRRMNEINSFTTFNKSVLLKTIETHYYLTNIINGITKLNKRSFSAKYLHFHLPDFFFIYDSRAAKSISRFKIKVPKDIVLSLDMIAYDRVYADFSCKCFELSEQIKEKFDFQLTPRQLDNLLLKRLQD